MLEFYQKRTLRNLLKSPLALILLVLICLFMMRIVYTRFSIEREMVVRRVEAEMKLESLRERKAQLEEKVEYLSNERGIEAEMRRNFDVARPGEKVVIILDKEPESVIEPLQPMGGTDDVAWYQFWR